MTKVNTVHWTESSNWTPVDLRDDSPTSSAGKLRIELFSPTNNRILLGRFMHFVKTTAPRAASWNLGANKEVCWLRNWLNNSISIRTIITRLMHGRSFDAVGRSDFQRLIGIVYCQNRPTPFKLLVSIVWCLHMNALFTGIPTIPYCQYELLKRWVGAPGS